MQEGAYVVFQVTAVTTQERFLFKKNFFGPEKCGFYSREVTKRERLLMARVRYVNLVVIVLLFSCLAYFFQKMPKTLHYLLRRIKSLATAEEILT